jgi:hypothetical protein
MRLLFAALGLAAASSVCQAQTESSSVVVVEPSGATSAARNPSPAPNLALRPVITLVGGRQIKAGTAFALSLPDGRLAAVTALHLFGEAGGYDRDIPANLLANTVLRVDLYNMDYSKKLATAKKALVHTGYLGRMRGREYDISGDVAVFEIESGSTLTPTQLASEVKAGEPVWVVGREYNDAGESPKRFPGTVAEIGDFGTAVALRARFEPRGFSGGPVVNAQGQIVGIVIGGGEIDGRNIALVNPAKAIRERMGSLLKRREEAGAPGR